MQFWKVAIAILMFKALDLAWAWASVVSRGRFDWAPFVAMTVFWFFVSALAWAIVRAIALTIARDRSAR